MLLELLACCALMSEAFPMTVAFLEIALAPALPGGRTQPGPRGRPVTKDGSKNDQPLCLW